MFTIPSMSTPAHSSLRQTGRTTRMMQQACQIAAEHPHTTVFVITHTVHYGRILRRQFEPPPNDQGMP